MEEQEIKELQYRLAEYGDMKAFEELYHYFYGKLMPFAFMITKDRFASEEIVEDVFLNLWHKRDDAAGIKRLKVYLFVAVKNRSLNFLKLKVNNLVEYFEHFSDRIHINANTPESRLLDNELASKIKEAVEALPPKCKLIFKLVREEELKYREVADILEISPRTVNNQMTIAMTKLKEAIISYHPIKF